MIKPALALRRWVLIGCLSLAIAAMVTGPAGAQSPGNNDLTVPSLEARLADVESSSAIDEQARKSAADLYRSAIESLQRAADLASQTTEFRRLASEAPQLLVTIRAELTKPPAEPSITAPDGASLQQLEQSLTQASAGLQAARQLSAELQSESIRRNERRSALPEQTAKARQQLIDLDEPATLPPNEGEALALTDARRAAQEARRLVLQREIEALEAEAASYDARRELLPARLDRAQRRVAESEKQVAAWQTIVTAQRQIDADRAARDAQRLRREAASQHPVLRAFAEATAQMARDQAGPSSIAEQIDRASRDASQTRSELAALHTQFTSIERRLDATGLNRATGLLLRRQYETLPEEAMLRRHIRNSQKKLEATEYALIELQEDRLDAGDIDRVAQRLIARIPSEEITNGTAELEQVARELATARRDLLDQRIGDTTAYFDNLVELNSAQRDTLEDATTYRAFIEERILWVRSVAGDRWPSVADVSDAVAWLVDPAAWTSTYHQTRRFIAGRWLVVAIGAALLLLIWLLGMHCRSRIRELADLVSRFKTDSFRYTIYALLLTVALAAPLAVAMFAAGWLLGSAEGQPDVAIATGYGLRIAALVIFPLMLLRQTLRPKGLAEAHFRWSKSTIQPLRRNLRWFVPLIAPIALLVATIDHSGIESHNASLGRILYTTGLLALAYFLHRIFRSKGPVMRRFMEDNTNNWAHRLRHLWRPLIVLAPLTLAVLSWMGFHYTALQLESRLEQSLALGLVLVLASGVMHRWLLIARRRLAVEEARRRREQAIADAESKRAAGDVPEDSALPLPPTLDEDKLDLPSLSSSTRQLFRASITVAVVAGLFLIWAEALPALRMLDRMQVWPTIKMVDASADVGLVPDTLLNVATPTDPSAQNSGAIPALPTAPGAAPTIPASDTDTGSASESVSVTVADIGFSLLALFVTWVAFRNVPALAEIVVLQRLPFDAGSRYALSTILRYCIAIIGVVIAFNALGLSWNKVQWLAAALTFGLAFGLQEIFANFVSGLIILAERPIRLGDTVTVGGVTGTVTRIRMRATTIADWDRKELVIPNKTFITGEVINWTLSDPVLRVIIPVGVSYDSDVELVNKLLHQVAAESPTVLADPKPHALFRNFGDNTLDFELRVFIGHIENLQVVKDDLHHAIIKAFRKAGVEIAFPQRDLHIRSLGGLESLIQKREDLPASEQPSSG